MNSLILFLALVATDKPKADSQDVEKPAAAQPATVADPTYTPQVGDRVWLDSRQRDAEGAFAVPTAVSVADFQTYARLSMEGNEAAIDKLEEQKKLVLIDSGTEVLVVALSPVELVRTDRAVGGVVCATVKILSGEEKGKTLYTPPHSLVRYVNVADTPAAPATKRASTKKKGTAKKVAAASPAPPPNPAARAASLLRIGHDLEKAAKTKGAADLYRQIVKQYPTSSQAKIAEERLKALDVK